MGLDQSMWWIQRESAGSWSQTPVPSPPPVRCDTCDGMPGSDGEVCEYSYSQLDPLAGLVSGTGELGALYVHRHYAGTLVADCAGPFCSWMTASAESSGDLYFVSPDGRPVPVLIGSALFTEGQVRVDPLGRIHIAVYDQSFGDLTGRYLRLDPLD